VAESGVSISGDELGPIRRLFGPVEGDSTSVGPTDASPASEYRVGGYFMIGAGEEQAAELAESHPHRRNGGWVEVAPVVMR